MVEPVRRAEGSIRDPGGDLELARDEPAPRREDQHVDREQPTLGFGRSRLAFKPEDGHRVSNTSSVLETSWSRAVRYDRISSLVLS